MASKGLEARLARIEDLEAIRTLKAIYCDICDDGHDPDRIVEIFSEDGVWEIEGIARAEGHAELRALFERFRDEVSFSQHQVMNPIIEVEGERAHGTWYFFAPFTFREKDQARWLAARYEDDYVKVGGVWKIRRLCGIVRMATDYERSWATVEPEASEAEETGSA
ncbi:MAG: nuclear transport factor 2 family protein [Deltaproteobacteria bacterium]|jgi:hypothetical protein|nr:nuclear transport factor 2 family protein [Deltaproteobacteria bacterium]MBW2500031.1 nuclear transport factor 2 family protein [Deltaproteobacteria bacterium]